MIVNIYNYEDGKLQVKTVVTKSLEDVQQCIANNRPQKGIDANIAAYIPTLDPAQIQADEWYECLLTLEAPVEAGKEEPVLNEDGEYTYDDDGQLITSVGLNSHERALNKRKELESTNPWLKGLRGVKSAPKRPEFTLTVEEWKENNQVGRNIFKQNRAEKVSKIVVDVGGLLFDGDEDSQTRMARALIGMEDTQNIPWVLHDNTLANVSKTQLIAALRLSGQAQTSLWAYENNKN